MLPALERRHDELAPTLPGHAGVPPLDGEVSAALLAHQLRGGAACEGVLPMIEYVLREGYHLGAEHIACPVRVVWGTEDRLLPWPSAAARFRRDWLPHADWVELDGVGHCPQLDVPFAAAQLILGFTAR